MGQLKTFMLEAEEAGADVSTAYKNFIEGGMLWDQAIAEAISEDEQDWDPATGPEVFVEGQ